MRKYRLCLLVILIAFCIQGCSKQQDVEDHSFVLAMGFERINEKKLKQYKSQQLNFGHLKVVIFGNGKKNVKIIKELVEEPQIAKSVYVLKTDHNLSDIFGKEDKLSISFGEYLSKKLEIKDSQNLTLGRIYR